MAYLKDVARLNCDYILDDLMAIGIMYIFFGEHFEAAFAPHQMLARRELKEAQGAAEALW